MSCTSQTFPDSDLDVEQHEEQSGAPAEEERKLSSMGTLLTTSSSEDTSSSSDEDTQLPPTKPLPRPIMRTRKTPAIPLAVSILSTPGFLLTGDDVSKMIPEMFLTYDGPGGEAIRALFHSMLAEYKTNVDDNYAIHGSIKFALFVSFIEVCCAFTPSPTEEICAIVTCAAKAFMTSIRSLFKRDVYLVASGYTKESTVPRSIEEQVKVACTILHDEYDPTELNSPPLEDIPFQLVLQDTSPTSKRPKPMFLILHQYASTRETAVYMYAHNVRAQTTNALTERSIYTAHILLRYFIYTLAVLCRLAIFDWRDALQKVNGVQKTASDFIVHKINSTLCSNFNDLCVYFTSKQYGYEAKIREEYVRFSGSAVVEKSEAAQSTPVASSRVTAQRSEPFRPDMTMGGVAPVQQESGCLIL
jgi:hypothetical protein